MKYSHQERTHSNEIFEQIEILKKIEGEMQLREV